MVADIKFSRSLSAAGLAPYKSEPHPSGIGTLIRDVEIFSPTQRWNPKSKQVDDFGTDYIDRAVQNFQERRSKGFMPPVHTQHIPVQGKDPENRLVGHIDSMRVDRDDEGNPVVFADLWITEQQAEAEIARLRWPYRSIEILDPAKAEFSSLALLDYKVPFFKYRMLAIENPQSAQQFGEDWAHRVTFNDEHPNSVSVLFADPRIPGELIDPTMMDDDMGGYDDIGGYDDMGGGEDELLELLMMLEGDFGEDDYDEYGGEYEDDYDDYDDMGGMPDDLDGLGAPEESMGLTDEGIMGDNVNGAPGLDPNALQGMITSAVEAALANQQGAKVGTTPSAPPMVASNQPARNPQHFGERPQRRGGSSLVKAVNARLGQIEKSVDDRLKRIEDTIEAVVQFAQSQQHAQHFNDLATQIDDAAADHVNALFSQFTLTEAQKRRVIEDYGRMRDEHVGSAIQQFSEKPDAQVELPDLDAWRKGWVETFAGSSPNKGASEGVMPAAATFAQPNMSAVQFAENDADCKQVFGERTPTTDEAKAAMALAREWDSDTDLQAISPNRAAYIRHNLEG